ncbi:hypothetical protein MHU86_4762 [Fragilaria crotonensis]|nr:hypothetical protein MHU86_4762 [Fragilaria crotonensis]
MTSMTTHASTFSAIAAACSPSNYSAYSDPTSSSLHNSVPHALEAHRCNPDHYPIVIDSGASVSITPNINDFVNGIHPTQLSDLKGLEGATKVHGQGIVEWTVFDLMDVVRTIRTTAYYVPSATIRLFSPQSYFQESNSGSYLMDAHTTRLTLRDGTQLIFPYNHGMNIPLMLPAVGRQKEVVNLSYQDMKVFSDQEHGLAYMSVADESNQNLTRAQMELLQWHWRLGHCNFQWIQSLAATLARI